MKYIKKIIVTLVIMPLMIFRFRAEALALTNHFKKTYSGKPINYGRWYVWNSMKFSDELRLLGADKTFSEKDGAIKPKIDDVLKNWLNAGQ